MSAQLSVAQYGEARYAAALASATVTLGGAPTPGNWMVAIFAQFTSAAPTVQAGWTAIQGDLPYSGSLPFVKVAMRQVQSGDAAAQTPFVTGNNTAESYCQVWEIHSDTPGVMPMLTHKEWISATATTTPTVSASAFTPTYAGGVALVSAYVANINSAAPATPSGFTAQSLQTGSGSRLAAFQAANISNLAAITYTWGTGTSAVPVAQTLVFEPAPAAGAILAQPAVISSLAGAGTFSIAPQGTPTLGNTLVAIALVAGAQTLTVQAGWQQIFSFTSGTFKYAVATRTAQVGDGTVAPYAASAAADCVLLELAGAATFLAEFAEGASANPPTVTLPSLSNTIAGSLGIICAVTGTTTHNDWAKDIAGWATQAILDPSNRFVACYTQPGVSGAAGPATVNFNGGTAQIADAVLLLAQPAPSSSGLSATWGQWCGWGQ